MRVFFMARAYVVIDGGNLYYKLKAKQIGIKNTLTFNYKKFILWLVKTNKIIGCCYYVGQIREEQGNKKSKILKRDQDKLFSILRKQEIRVETGYIMKSGGEYHEKGVDVRMAVDMCMKAVRNEYDRLILISSDTDLIPAIKEVRSLKKHVEYVGFDFNPSFAMIRFSDSRTLLKKEDLLPFTKIKGK